PTATLAGHPLSLHDALPISDTGFVMDLADLGTLIKEEIEDRFDHKNLNLDCPEFRNLLPTTEYFVKVIYDILKPRLLQGQLLHIDRKSTRLNSSHVKSSYAV